jgi:tetratricopeptide (TPR) repeat protein
MVGDRSRIFTIGLIAAWVLLVAAPTLLSVALGQPVAGLPLLGVIAWFILLRVARRISPAAYVDALMRRGRYAQALARCDRALALTGAAAWTGSRRLIWLNRRTAALLGLGRADEALQAALDAVTESPDPETLGNCGLALLRLNRLDEANQVARQVIDLTRERSVVAHAVLAAVKLRRGMPAEAEALARAGLTDVKALMPLVKPEHHVLCLSILCRAQRAQGEKDQLKAILGDLRHAAGPNPLLQAMGVVDEIDGLADTLQARDRGFDLLEGAYEVAPQYVLWYVTQPGVLTYLRGDRRFLAYLDQATAEFQRLAETAPSAETTRVALEKAALGAASSPAQQSSRGALLAQVLTLSGTLILLLVWTWRFFIVGV